MNLLGDVFDWLIEDAPLWAWRQLHWSVLQNEWAARRDGRPVV